MTHKISANLLCCMRLNDAIAPFLAKSCVSEVLPHFLGLLFDFQHVEDPPSLSHLGARST
jgi:hypothetical protein